MSHYDYDSVTNNLSDSANRTFVTLDDFSPLTEEILFSVVPRRVRVSVGGPLLLVAGRGTKKEANFFSLSHVRETPRGGWNSDVVVLGIRVLKSDQRALCQSDCSGRLSLEFGTNQRHSQRAGSPCWKRALFFFVR